jgi:glycosyltransferase involved in cell wall biosynthesis
VTQTVSTGSSTSTALQPNGTNHTDAEESLDETAALGKPLQPSHRGSVDVSVLVPTRNENGNVAVLTERLTRAMSGTDRSWELLFVDDSDDATPHTVAALCSRYPQIHLLHRPPTERVGGLSGAVVAGFDAARGRAIVVMDGDLQHPPDMARELATPVLSGRCDIAIASRYVAGASAAGIDGGRRHLVSRASSAVVHAVVPRTRGVRDPMSGFFAVSPETVTDVRLRPHGFKILMEVLARGRSERVVEVPFRFDRRADGESKAGAQEGIRFLRHLARLARPTWSTPVNLVRRITLQVPLAGILALQSWLSVRLIYRNTAFVDEATYISAGHYMLASSHRTANMHFATYFSGAPTIYPVLAGLVDGAGGLHAVRFLSMGVMLLATILCYATARTLFGRPAGWFAAGVFVTTQGTQFLGAFATFDAMALMLIALAAWLVARCARSATSTSAIYLAVPVLVFANATKYASGIFDPVVIALAFFVILGRHGLRPALRVCATLVAGLVMALAVVLAFTPHSYLKGLLSTTVSRPASNATPHLVLSRSWAWVGAIACMAGLATLAAALLAWRRRTSWATVGALAVMAVAVLLVPTNQARIHTATSLSKHVTFGAWFGALAAGWLLGKLAGQRPRDIWRYPIVAAVLLPMGLAGIKQARHQYDDWPNATPLVAALRPLISGQPGHVLVDNAEVPRYYLQNALSLPHWVDTFYLSYTPPGTTTRLLGAAAYAAAINNGWFSVVALDYGEQVHVDRAIASAIHTSKRYAWVGDFTAHSGYGRDTFVVWRLKGGPK